MDRKKLDELEELIKEKEEYLDITKNEKCLYEDLKVLREKALDISVVHVRKINSPEFSQSEYILEKIDTGIEETCVNVKYNNKKLEEIENKISILRGQAIVEDTIGEVFD